MPDLDVSFMTADLMLADTFDVTRLTDTVNAKGRTVPSAEQVFQGIAGVVTQQDPAGLMRTPDGQTVPRKIMVCSMFAFHGVNTGHQPDRITWNGCDYMVTEILPYSRFGAGTYEVIATSTTVIDDAQ